MEINQKIREYVDEEIQRRNVVDKEIQTRDGAYSEMNLIISTEDELLNMVTAISYVIFLENKFKNKYLAQTSILAIDPEKAMNINTNMVSLFQGKEYVYLSTDYISLSFENYNASIELYPQVLLNQLEYTHMSSHRLQLKVGMPIILLKKINRREGVVEGACLVITRLGPEEIIAEVLTGSGAGNMTIIRRKPVILDNTLQIIMYQFPVKVCFAMTIDSGRDQNLRNAGFYLNTGSYSQHPKYIGISTKEEMYGSSKLEITIIKKHHQANHYTKSTVYKQHHENSQFIDDTIDQTMVHAKKMDV